MAKQLPQPGQVIRYADLWWNEARLALEQGAKDRPCGIVLTRLTNAGHVVAYVLPITHTALLKDEAGIEIPLATQRRLELDAERHGSLPQSSIGSPGPVLTSGPPASGEYLYGYLPEKLMGLVLDQVRMHARNQRLKMVRRTD
jgi:hypothetical protein